MTGITYQKYTMFALFKLINNLKNYLSEVRM